MNLFRKKENCPTASIPVPGRVKRGFRRYALTVLTVLTACALAVPVSATGGDPLTVMDQVKDNRNTEAFWMERTMLRNAYKALSDREKEILGLRFFDGKTQMEVASRLGISQAQVSRLEKNAISAMRKSFSVS